MGSVGTSRNSVIYDIQTYRLNSYNFNDAQKSRMQRAIDDVQSAINSIMSNSWMTKDVEHLYDSLADYFPKSMEGDDAEKIISADGSYIYTVDIRLWENRDGKIEVTLDPASYSYDEFSRKELADMLGI